MSGIPAGFDGNASPGPHAGFVQRQDTWGDDLRNVGSTPTPCTMTKPSFIITGPARSGTRWVSEILNDLGIKCGHEYAFRPEQMRQLDQSAKIIKRAVIRIGYEDDEFDGDSSWMAAPYLSCMHPNVPIIHLIRDPKKTVCSLNGRLFNPKRMISINPYTELAIKYLQNYEHGWDDLKKSIQYWYEWNLKVEKYTQNRFKLEELQQPSKWAELTKCIGYPKSLRAINEVLKNPHFKNEKPKRQIQTPDFVWDDIQLPCINEVKQMIKRYGYSL